MRYERQREKHTGKKGRDREQRKKEKREMRK